MSKYRILEKKGEYKTKIEIRILDCPCHISSRLCKKCFVDKTEYVPRFIVQEGNPFDPVFKYIDIKEFTSLEEARAYKKDLELEEGIVRE